MSALTTSLEVHLLVCTLIVHFISSIYYIKAHCSYTVAKTSPSELLHILLATVSHHHRTTIEQV